MSKLIKVGIILTLTALLMCITLISSLAQSVDPVKLNGPAILVKSEVDSVTSEVVRIYMSFVEQESVHIILICPYFEGSRIPAKILDGKSIRYFIIRRKDRELIHEGYLNHLFYYKHFIE